MNPGGCFLFFVKNPVPGRVKTRIGRVVGFEKAARLYKCFVLDMLETFSTLDVPLRVHFHPPEAEAEIGRAFRLKCDIFPQQGPDLGRRMENAFSLAFAHGFDRAVLVGSDIPDYPAALLARALKALMDSDAVVGPSRDGGYHLIGFRKSTYAPEVFDGPKWSGPDVLEQTLSIMARKNISPAVWPLWTDMDRIEDLKSLMARPKGDHFVSSKTFGLLKTLPPAG